MRTFGRAVSLRDFEDTALHRGRGRQGQARPGSGTATRRAVHLTVAGAGRRDRSPPTACTRIAATLATERDPNQRLLIANYAPVAVRVGASIDRRRALRHAEVLAAARAAAARRAVVRRRRFAAAGAISATSTPCSRTSPASSRSTSTCSTSRAPTRPSARRTASTTRCRQPQPRLLMLPGPAGRHGRSACCRPSSRASRCPRRT